MYSEAPFISAVVNIEEKNISEKFFVFSLSF